MKLARALLSGIFLLAPAWALAQDSGTEASTAVIGLDDVTVVLIRHAEKPSQGPDLAPAGEQRAVAYTGFFDPLRVDGKVLLPQRLIASSDSASSDRPRLTLTPLSTLLQLPIEQPYSDKQYATLAGSLRQSNTASVVLVCWHHGELPDLISALGGDPESLIGSKKWPGDVYDWAVVMHFDHKGKFDAKKSKLVQEYLLPGDGI